jgi:hypothetical protein
MRINAISLVALAGDSTSNLLRRRIFIVAESEQRLSISKGFGRKGE